MLGICSAMHIAILLLTVSVLRRIGRNFPNASNVVKSWAFLGIAFCSVVIAHTVQVWSWAVAFVSMGALSSFSDSIYFSIVTYTTLGYGDVIIEPQYRIFGAMAAVTGLLNFGLSTAFLVGLFSRVLQWLGHEKV